MPSQRDNEENNRLSRGRQQRRRDRDAALDAMGGLDAFGFSYGNEQLLEDLKARQARIGNSYDTRQSKRLRDLIDRLEAARSEAIAKFDADFNNQTSELNEVDTTSDNDRIQMPTFDERERDAGLTDTDIGKKIIIPTFEERESAAGLGDTTSGRSFFQDNEAGLNPPDVDMADGSFPAIICINGRPFIASIVGQIGGAIS